MAEQEGDAYKNSEHLHDGKNLERYKGTKARTFAGKLIFNQNKLYLQLNSRAHKL